MLCKMNARMKSCKQPSRSCKKNLISGKTRLFFGLLSLFPPYLWFFTWVSCFLTLSSDAFWRSCLENWVALNHVANLNQKISQKEIRSSIHIPLWKIWRKDIKHSVMEHYSKSIKKWPKLITISLLHHLRCHQILQSGQKLSLQVIELNSNLKVLILNLELIL